MVRLSTLVSMASKVRKPDYKAQPKACKAHRLVFKVSQDNKLVTA